MYAETERVAVIMQEGDSSKVLQALDSLRMRGIVSECFFSKSPKAQIRLAIKRGYTNLIYIDGDTIMFQDLYKYPDWMCKEYGTVNFEKRVYQDMYTCIQEEQLTYEKH